MLVAVRARLGEGADAGDFSGVQRLAQSFSALAGGARAPIAFEPFSEVRTLYYKCSVM